MLTQSFFQAKSGIPIPMEDLCLWLKADTGVSVDGSNFVFSWADQSGNGNDVIQTNEACQPQFVENVLNGKPVLRFTGSSDFMRRIFSETINQPISIYVIFRIVGGGLLYIIDGINSFHSIRNDNGYIQMRTSGGTFGFYEMTTDIFYLSEGIFNGYSSKLFKNGILKASGITNGNMDGITVGSYYGVDTAFFVGDIAEILLYNSELSDTKRIQVEQYLLSKYRL